MTEKQARERLCYDETKSEKRLNPSSPARDYPESSFEPDELPAEAALDTKTLEAMFGQTKNSNKTVRTSVTGVSSHCKAYEACKYLPLLAA